MDRRSLGAPLPAYGDRHRLARAQAVAEGFRITRKLTTAALVAAIAVGLWMVLRPAHHARTLLVGVDDDTLKWTPFPLTVVRRQQALGAGAVRVWVPWRGERAPDGTRRVELARAETAARHTEVVLAVFGFAVSTPTTPAQQNRFCDYARSAVQLVPDARAVVVWNEANSPTYWRGTPAQYESLLARCYDRLHSGRVQVLDSTASAHDPIAFLDAIANAYRTSGRRRPLVDAFGHNPYPLDSQERPNTRHAGDFLGEGDYDRLVATLHRDFGPSVTVWYLEDGFQSRAPAHGYRGRENVPVVSPALQARDVGAAIRLAACQPLVRAFFNFELVDEKRLAGWQSGLIWRGATLKPAASSFSAAARAVHAGQVRCRP